MSYGTPRDIFVLNNNNDMSKESSPYPITETARKALDAMQAKIVRKPTMPGEPQTPHVRIPVVQRHAEFMAWIDILEKNDILSSAQANIIKQIGAISDDKAFGLMARRIKAMREHLSQLATEGVISPTIAKIADIFQPPHVPRDVLENFQKHPIPDELVKPVVTEKPFTTPKPAAVNRRPTAIPKVTTQPASSPKERHRQLCEWIEAANITEQLTKPAKEKILKDGEIAENAEPSAYSAKCINMVNAISPLLSPLQAIEVKRFRLAGRPASTVQI